MAFDRVDEEIHEFYVALTAIRCKNVKMAPIKEYNCPSNGGLFTLHYVVIFKGES